MIYMYSSIHTTDFKLVALSREREWLRNEGGSHALLNSLALGALLQGKREAEGRGSEGSEHTSSEYEIPGTGRDDNAGNTGNASAGMGTGSWR